MRASEDLREREAMLAGSAKKHTYDWLAKQIIDSRNVATTPRDGRQVSLPPVPTAARDDPRDKFWAGDKVKLAAEKADQLDAGWLVLAFGTPAGWEPKTDSPGTVIVGGRRWKGDCMVEMDQQRLWFKSTELEMAEKSTKSRPTTAEELKAMNKRRMPQRKKWVTSNRLARAKWEAKLKQGPRTSEGVLTMDQYVKLSKKQEESTVQFELAMELPNDPVELEELRVQIGIDIAAALDVDVRQVGEIGLSAPE